jgi:hypothetical protein
LRRRSRGRKSGVRRMGFGGRGISSMKEGG